MSDNTIVSAKVSFFHGVAILLGYGCYLLLNILFLSILPIIVGILWIAPNARHFFFDTLYRCSLVFLTRIWLPFLRIYTIDENTENIPPTGQPAILIANHRSRIEGPLILSNLRNVGVLIKSRYARLPVFSSLVKHSNFVSVDQYSIGSLAQALVQCKSLLSGGNKLLIFPEGARARSKRMLPFKDMAFRLSIDSDIAIVPIVIHTDYPFMAKIRGSVFPPVTMKITLRTLPPVKCLPGERSTDFCERVRRMMAIELKKLDAGTVWEHY